MKIEFLLAGSPNDAFYSQVAMFRLALDALGSLYHDAKVLLLLTSDDGPTPVPQRWLPWFERIEIRWADPSYAFLLNHGRELYGMADTEADLSIICDADTMFLRPLPEDLLRETISTPTICGVVAHQPPLLNNFDDFEPPSTPTEMWERMGAALGCAIDLTVPYSMKSDGSLGPSFYVNLGFLLAPPDLIRRLGVLQEEVRPALESVLTNRFDDQIAIALAVEVGKLPHRRLPFRYNYRNDMFVDRMYPDEMDNIILLHYQTRRNFDRHVIFATKDAFDEFMAMSLKGSDMVFQDTVRRLTQGIYPFDAE